jgi:hypothetical protein
VHRLEELDTLGCAFVAHLEVGSRQIGDRFAGLVHDHRVDEDEIGIRAKDRSRLLRRGGRHRVRKQRRQPKRQP